MYNKDSLTFRYTSIINARARFFCRFQKKGDEKVKKNGFDIPLHIHFGNYCTRVIIMLLFYFVIDKFHFSNVSSLSLAFIFKTAIYPIYSEQVPQFHLAFNFLFTLPT